MFKGKLNALKNGINNLRTGIQQDKVKSEQAIMRMVDLFYDIAWLLTEMTEGKE